MFKWLFTEEHRKQKEALRQARKERVQGYLERETSKPKTEDRPKPAPSAWKPKIFNSINNTNVNVQSNGHSYQRTVRNGVETIIVDGKVLTGDEAKNARVKHENWVSDFKDDMADFAEDMRDMAKDMRDMFK